MTKGREEIHRRGITIVKGEDNDYTSLYESSAQKAAEFRKDAEKRIKSLESRIERLENSQKGYTVQLSNIRNEIKGGEK